MSDEQFRQMSDDPLNSLHRRFDKLESNFKDVRDEQHKMAINLMTVDKRIDLMEVQVEAAQKRESLVVGTINEKLENNLSLIKKLFEKFDQHTESEAEDRKKLLFWLVTTGLSVALTAATIVFQKVFGV